MRLHFFQDAVELRRHDRFIDVTPPDIILGAVFLDYKPVVRGAPRVFAGHRDKRTVFGKLSFLALQCLLKQRRRTEVPVSRLHPIKAMIVQSVTTGPNP